MTQFGFDVPSQWPDMEVPTKVLPLYGFYPLGLPGFFGGGPWMKRRGCLVVYFASRRSYDISITLKSDFPEQLLDGVNLYVSVCGTRRDKLEVKSGNQSTMVNLNIGLDELTPMGNRGAYAVINLESSLAHSHIGHSIRGDSHWEISFQMSDWTINNKRFKWWWQ